MNTIESRAKEGGRWNSTQIPGELATEKSEKRRHLPALAPQVQQPDKDTLITSFSFFPWDLIMGRSLGGFSLLGGYAHIINTGETRKWTLEWNPKCLKQLQAVSVLVFTNLEGKPEKEPELVTSQNGCLTLYCKTIKPCDLFQPIENRLWL